MPDIILADIMFYLGCTLVAVALFMQNMLKLRLIYLAATIIGLVYGLYTGNHTIAIISIILALINLYGLVMLKRKKELFIMPADLEDVYQPYRSCISAKDFMHIMEVAEDELIMKNHLLKENQHVSELKMILRGEATVYWKNNIIGVLGPGDFIGEISLITDKGACASVYCEAEVSLLKWDNNTLKELKNSFPEDYQRLLDIISYNLANKLVRTRDLHFLAVD